MKKLIYQILPRYWGLYKGENVRSASLERNGCGHFADIDSASLEYFKSLGCDYIWYTGVIRHSTLCDTAGCSPSHPQFVKGNAGSPYAIYDYYDVNPYLALDPARRMDEFRDLVKRTHEKGMKVLIDFVPNHVSRDNVNFGLDDNKEVHWCAENDFYYYPGEALTLPTDFKPDSVFEIPYREYPARATGNNCFNSHPQINDWYETVKLNYCDFHTGTWDKMLDILSHWADMGVDGFRCDMVELVPAEFFTWLIAAMKQRYPDIFFVAEVYKKDSYRNYLREVGFDLLYDKSGVYDSLHDILLYNLLSSRPVELWQSARRLTSTWQFLGDMQPQMLNFLENHDEVRLCSQQFALEPRNTYAALAVSMLFNQASFMLYAGQEVGESGAYNEGFSGPDGRSTIFDWWRIDSLQRLFTYIHEGKGLTAEEADLLQRYRNLTSIAKTDVFAKGEMYDLCWCNYNNDDFDPDRNFAFIRYDAQDVFLVFCNFSGKKAACTLEIPIFGIKSCHVEAEPYDYMVLSLNDRRE